MYILSIRYVYPYIRMYCKFIEFWEYLTVNLFLFPQKGYDLRVPLAKSEKHAIVFEIVEFKGPIGISTKSLR